MRCAYCTESGMYTTTNCEAIVPEFCDFIDRIINSGERVSIGFWGGEPSLKSDVIIEITNRYLDDDRVKFFIYTNGFNTPPKLLGLIYSLKDKMVQGEPKFFTQISYDGQPIHDLKRKRGSQDGTTSMEVRATIQWAKQNRIPFSLKSTITMDTLQHLYEAYMDVNSLVVGGNTSSVSSYFPTLDYFNNFEDDEHLEEYLQSMRDNLKRIAATMITAQRKNLPYADFKWFTSSKADCSAGVGMFSVDTDGSLYVCHGCFYTDKKEDHLVGHIKDPISILAASKEKHSACANLTPIECKSCEATFCVRCNTVRYSVSEKETYGERWKDYTNNHMLCHVYKEIGKISRAYQRISGVKR